METTPTFSAKRHNVIDHISLRTFLINALDLRLVCPRRHGCNLCAAVCARICSTNMGIFFKIFCIIFSNRFFVPFFPSSARAQKTLLIFLTPAFCCSFRFFRIGVQPISISLFMFFLVAFARAARSRICNQTLPLSRTDRLNIVALRSKPVIPFT